MPSVDQVALLPEQGSPAGTAFFETSFCPSRSRARWPGDTWRLRRMIVRARSALLKMQLDDASRLTAQLRRHLSERRHRHSARYAQVVRTLEACIHLARDEPSAARSLLAGVPLAADDSLAGAIVRYADWKCGESDELCTPDTVEYLVDSAGGKTLSGILSLCLSAALAFDRLQLSVTASLAAEALQLARARYGNHSPVSSLPATLLAQVAYEQGRFEEAEALLRSRFSVIQASGTLECVVRASLVLSRLYLHRGQDRAAMAVLREAEALGRARRWPRLVSVVSAEYARVVEKAECALKRAGQPMRAGGASWRPVSARVWTSVSDDARSLHKLTATFASLEAALRRISLIASQDPEGCDYAPLIPWLRMGAVSGLRMVFVDAGASLLRLLERLYQTPPSIDPRLSELRPYIATVLRAAARPKPSASASEACRPLSRRETGILRMIAHGMSNKRIARTLGITPETVKSHAKSIFLKLSTRTRAQAVARAEASGFL